MYAAFGKVIEGMDIIKEIESDTFEYSDEQNGMLATPLTLETASVDTKGHEYKVEKIETSN